MLMERCLWGDVRKTEVVMSGVTERGYTHRKSGGGRRDSGVRSGGNVSQ